MTKLEYDKITSKQRRDRRREEGLCAKCGKTSNDNYLCRKCRVRFSAYAKERYRLKKLEKEINNGQK